MTVTVAIVGRPNVGKSTLFNRLVGRKIALVDDTPGVTRDRREAEGRIADLSFRLLDTAGYEDVKDGSLEDRMRQQTELAIKEADVVLFMIDARAGVVPLDQRLAQVLRKAGKVVHLVGNKAESGAAEAGLVEAFKLGFGEAIALSAEHGLGLSELYSIVSETIDRKAAEGGALEVGDLEDMPAVDVDITEDMLEGEGEEATLRWNPNRYLNVAIVGRPNAGKSTLINRMVGEEDRKSTRLNSSHVRISYAVFCLKKKKKNKRATRRRQTRGQGASKTTKNNQGRSRHGTSGAGVYIPVVPRARANRAECTRWEDVE